METPITMTFIEVQEKRLKRKKEELQTLEDVIASTTASNSVKTRYIELKAEIRELESCLDLAKVMFDGKKTGDNPAEK